MAPSRDDTRLLLFATGLVVLAGVLVAAVLLLATGRSSGPTEYEPFDAGAAAEIERVLKAEGPYYVPDPFGGNRSIIFALEDGEVVALSIVLPNTKDCVIDIKNEGKRLVDCNGDRQQTTDLARFETSILPRQGVNDALLVDLRTKLPPPSTVSSTPTG